MSEKEVQGVEEVVKVEDGTGTNRSPSPERMRKPRFTVVPVRLSEWNPEREGASSAPLNEAIGSSKLEAGRVTPLMKEEVRMEPLNGVPPSLVPVVLPRGSSNSPRVPKRKSADPFARLRGVPHGATIPPLHETGADHALRDLLESQRSISFGHSDGHTIKVLSSMTSSQFLESGSIHGRIPSRGEIRRHGNDDQGDRSRWRTKLEFLLACVGACVGFGSFWRLPYLCLTYGRGAFLVPYLVIFLLGGVPLLYAELFLGQYTQRGPIEAFKRVCPFMRGVGTSLLVVALFSSCYYSLVFSDSILSLGLVLGDPIVLCNASVLCPDGPGVGSSSNEGRNFTSNGRGSATVEDNRRSAPPVSSVEATVALGVTLTGTWIVVYFALWKSVRSISKVAKVSATLPFFLYTAFVWRALTLPGATEGLQFLFTPQWSFLLQGQVWVSAGVQVLTGLNTGSGALVAFSSYACPRNRLGVDVGILSAVSVASSFLAVVVVFAGVGNVAAEAEFVVTEIDFTGADLALVVYPHILSKMPRRHLWSALFFLLLVLLGIDSQFSYVEVIVTSLIDALDSARGSIKSGRLKKIAKSREGLVGGICGLCFLSSLPFVVQGSSLLDHMRNLEAMNSALLFVALCEVVTLSWCFGADRISHCLFEMTSRRPSFLLSLCWRFVTPALILILWVTSIVTQGSFSNKQVTTGVITWSLMALCVTPLPLFAILELCARPGSLTQRVREASSPRAVTNPEEWGCATYDKERSQRLALFRYSSKNSTA